MLDNTELKYRFEVLYPQLERLATELQEHVADCLKKVLHIDRISFRAKEMSSFLKKCSNKSEDGSPKYISPFSELEDLVAGRVITFFLDDLPVVEAALDATFVAIEGAYRTPTRDAEFGYQSVHRVYHIPQAMRAENKDVPKTFEMQLRTIFMHAYAEPQHNVGYKSTTDISPELRKELAWIAASAWGGDQAYKRVVDALKKKELP